MTDPLAASQPHTHGGRRATLGEVGLVFGATVGVSFAGSLWAAHHGGRAAVAFTDAHLAGVLAYEALLAALLLPWLTRRGWSPRRVAGGAPAPRDVAIGGALWLATVACYTLSWGVFAALQPDAARALAGEHRFAGGASALAVVAASVLNPVFEEFLWLGYGVPSLAPRLGLRGACALSVALRVSVHLYQGAWAVLGILPVGLCLTWYYARTRRLWPVVVAHVILDAVGLAQYLAARG